MLVLVMVGRRTIMVSLIISLGIGSDTG